MQKRFYHPHTVLTSIDELDERWLKKQLEDKPFDMHFQYLAALFALSKGAKADVLDAIANMRLSSDNAVRVSGLLERLNAGNPKNEHSISYVSIKSKIAEEAVKNNIILTGLESSESLDSEVYQYPEYDFPLENILTTSTSPTYNLKEAEEAEEEEKLEANNIDHHAEHIIDDINEAVAEPHHISNELVVDIIDVEEEDILDDDLVFLFDHEDTGVHSDLVGNSSSGEGDKFEAKETEHGDSHDYTADSTSDTTSEENHGKENQGKESQNASQHTLPAVLDKEKESEKVVGLSPNGSSFTNWLNTLPNLETQNSTSTTQPSSLPISESLALLLIKQGHLEDAKAMYTQLIDKYPEKSSFFADQIKKLS